MEDFSVFLGWDLLKGRVNNVNLTLSKTRFKAVLNKALHIGAIQPIESADKDELHFKFCPRQHFYDRLNWKMRYSPKEREAAHALIALAEG